MPTTITQPWGQVAGNRAVFHSPEPVAPVVVIGSRFGAQGRAQGFSAAKALISRAKIAFSTGRRGLYYYYQS
jgi:hypothetical protein